MASVVVLAATLATGYAAGRASGAVPAVIPAGDAAACRAPAVPAGSGLDPLRVAELVGAVVRDELASARARDAALEPAAVASSGRGAPPAPPDPVALEVERMLDDALLRGRWELDDQVRLRHALGTLTDPAREGALLQRLAAAVNAGELEVGFDGPMF